MKFVAVEEVPKNYRRHHKLKRSLEEFMSSSIKTVKVELDEGEYSTIYVARKCIMASIARFGHPIDTTICDGEIYLIRRDI